MKILVFSDSHASLRFMRRAIETVKPDAVIHLGDYFDDGAAIAEEFHWIRFSQVPGNCDQHRCPPFAPMTLVEKICGVTLFMTHGHIHNVKLGLGSLISDGRKCGAQVVLFGHTHSTYCAQEDDGLWVVNPGSCGYYGGSAALIETDGGVIKACRILDQSALDTMV